VHAAYGNGGMSVNFLISSCRFSGRMMLTPISLFLGSAWCFRSRWLILGLKSLNTRFGESIYQFSGQLELVENRGQTVMPYLAASKYKIE
jgi:hypothetical protein